MKKIALIAIVLLTLFINSCSKDSNDPQPNPTPSVTLDNEVNNFVWKGLNSWYNWQSNVPNLSDTKDDNSDDYYTYLNGFSNPEDLFTSLLYQYVGTVGEANAVDRFSWFIDDYDVQNQQFQGISKSFGFRLQAVQINDTDIIFYVRYVAPNSPASDAGIKRGDIINALDDIVLTVDNYSSTVDKLSNETVKLSFVENDGSTHKDDKTITAIVLSVNPVHFYKVFDDIGGRKVGYLVYNAFQSSYNDELNAVFADFKSQGVNELVLDLRLNGGGSVLTSAYLASMIDANAGTDIFANLKFNAKHSDSNGAYTFENTMNIYDTDGFKTGEESINRLPDITRLYVLTSGSTASASEMIINGLKAFMPVKVIGTTTYGKNVGSITLYDSPSSDYTSEASANSSHKNAMQPIVFQIYNKNNQSDYIQGFTPDIEVKEWNYWDNILPFGDENEVVLKAALDDIRGVVTRTSIEAKSNSIDLPEIKQLQNRFDKEMYIDNDFFKNQ